MDGRRRTEPAAAPRRPSTGPSAPGGAGRPSEAREASQASQAARAVFVAGFLAFAMLYVAQGILPAVSRDFGVSPATASLTLSLSTLPLAAAVLLAASLSDGYGRWGLLVGALVGGALLSMLAAASPGLPALLALRVLTGLVLAGLPAAAMAYVAEEVGATGLGAAMGLYISGTALGGMTGRLAGGLVAGALSWRWALGLVGAAGLAGSCWIAVRLPRSRHFTRHPGGPLRRLRALREVVRDPALLGLAGCGFVLMGSLVSVYNYLQYRLAAAPFGLSRTVVPLVFTLYLAGAVSSTWMGRLTDRRSRRRVLLLGFAIMAAGILLTLPDELPLVLLGTATVTFGFFGAHAVASGWVNVRAGRCRAQASALYLCCYHLGSSAVGFAAGLLYGAHGWAGEVGTVAALLAVGLLVASRLPTVAGRREAPDAS